MGGAKQRSVYYTGHPENVCTWLREISCCSCLTVLPGPAWVLLSKTYILFPGALYSLWVWVRPSFEAKRFGMLPHAVSRNSSFQLRGARCAEETIEEKSCLHQSLQKVFHPNGSSRQKLFLCKSLSVRLLDRMSRARPTDTICVRPTKTCRAHCCLARMGSKIFCIILGTFFWGSFL